MNADHTEPDPDPDRAPTSSIPPEQLDHLLQLWATAWVSGYASAGLSAAHRAGVDEHERQALAVTLERMAWHTASSAVKDPVTREAVVELIEHTLSGQPWPGPKPVAREIAVSCDHAEHQHLHGDPQARLVREPVAAPERSPRDAWLLRQAATRVVDRQSCFVDDLVRALDVTEGYARTLVDLLEEHHVVSPPSALGTSRAVLVRAEDLPGLLERLP